MIKFTIKYKINKLQLSWIAVRVLPIMKMNTFLLIDFIDAFDLNSMNNAGDFNFFYALLECLQCFKKTTKIY